MPTPAAGTIGSLDYTAEERQILAKKSRNWQCEICGKISENLSSSQAKSTLNLTQEEASLIQQIALKVS
jgi:ubiquitin-conjugating enzyme E2 J1